MNVSKIMELIDDEKLASLGELCKINKVNNKITGSFVLKSFVQSILAGRKLSLRSLEIMCNQNKNLSDLLNTKDESKKHIDHSSLGKRLETIRSTWLV